MKQFSILIATLLIVSTSFAMEKTVRDAEADALIDALKGAAAGERTTEMTVWSVSKVKMIMTPRGFIWAQGDFYDEVAKKNVDVLTNKASDIYSALVAIGIPSTDPTDNPISSSSVSAQSIECQRGYNVGARRKYSVCKVQW